MVNAKPSRAAIVIGNANYAESPLRNPINDARAIDEKLKELQFKTIYRTDVDRRGLFAALSEFRSEFETATVALLFYAGHGIQADGKNYLLPVEAKLRSLMDLDEYGVELKTFVDSLQEVDRRTSLLFLDCCRNNRFVDQIAAASKASKREIIPVRPGLAEVKAPKGTFIAFATHPDSTADDGSGTHSPFTQALLAHIDRPNQSISDMMIDVTNDVLKATSNLQQPWSQQSLTERIVFKAEAPKPSGSPAEEEWLAISASNSISVFETYIKEHPRSPFRKYADAKIQDIRAASAVSRAMWHLPSNPQLGGIPISPPLPPSRKKFGSANLMDARTLQGLVSISVFSVAKILAEGGRAIGSGFVVRGADIRPSLGEKLFVFTAGHVLDAAQSGDRTAASERVLVSFDGMVSSGLGGGPHLVKNVVARSMDDYDYALLDLGGLIDGNARPIPIARKLPDFDPNAPLSRSTRPPVISVSYPYGGGVKFGNVDNYLLDYDRSAVMPDGYPTRRPMEMHYTAASEPGSSGCPILNEDLEVIALHRGGTDRVRRLNGIDGTYAANFGVWIQSIIAHVDR